MLRIKLTRSTVGHNPRNRATMKALGLRKIGKVVEHEDTPSIRGMIHHVKEMLHVEVVEGTPARKVAPINTKKSVAAEAVAPVAKKATKVAAAASEEKPKKAAAPKKAKAEDK
jgi:large subunit ribosomal protein L30